jgi:glucose-6-phosphate isomerase
MSNKTLTQKPEWAALEKHHAMMAGARIDALFTKDKARFDNFHLAACGLALDYSKNSITSETMTLLSALAKVCGVEDLREKMFSGESINRTEKRAVLHTALRTPPEQIKIKDQDVGAYVRAARQKIKDVSTRLRKDGVFTDIVNIGIGGSDLGPHMVCEALKDFADGPRIHFVSNIDGTHLAQTLETLKPQTTLFVIASKTFTTLETMSNAKSARAWLAAALSEDAIADRFIAVTANEAAAKDFGIRPENILQMRDWIGGRYSLWSPIGLSIAIATGFESFENLLAGAYGMDKHFRTAPLEKNMPVILALIGLWHRNFCGAAAQAILPYAQNLYRLPAYIQQLDMESNGKSIDNEGRNIDYKTSPVVFGEPGTNSQHAFFQLLHQGTDIIPCDFIAPVKAAHALQDHHDNLLANMLAQSKALMDGESAGKEPHLKFSGNRPSNTILMDRLDAFHLGALLALYEHKVFVQGVIWNINSFDQWGVELGKKIARDVLGTMDEGPTNGSLESSTRGLLDYIRRHTA